VVQKITIYTQEYKKISSRFKDENLTLLEQKFKAIKEKHYSNRQFDFKTKIQTRRSYLLLLLPSIIEIMK
jgi:hypothetical protein